MTHGTRKDWIWFSLVLLVGLVGMTANLLRVGMAFNDPDMGLALEAFGKPSKLSYLRGKLYLETGGSADKPILHWGFNAPPLVACVESGDHELARALVGASSPATWQKAVDRACAKHRDSNDAMIRVLAEHRGIDPAALCARGMANGIEQNR